MTVYSLLRIFDYRYRFEENCRIERVVGLKSKSIHRSNEFTFCDINFIQSQFVHFQ